MPGQWSCTPFGAAWNMDLWGLMERNGYRPTAKHEPRWWFHIFFIFIPTVPGEMIMKGLQNGSINMNSPKSDRTPPPTFDTIYPIYGFPIEGEMTIPNIATFDPGTYHESWVVTPAKTLSLARKRCLKHVSIRWNVPLVDGFVLFWCVNYDIDEEHFTCDSLLFMMCAYYSQTNFTNYRWTSPILS